MAYFPASCNYDCKDCPQNKCGWCAFHDHPCIATVAETINPYNYSATITNEEIKEEEIKKASRELVEAVEKYLKQQILRQELWAVKNKLKELL